ncbi:MAG: type II toxin-antitoxin system VapC family toxin [Acidobacteriales bacterium]|nr:type II toxin-antitoxin system VapC family toxin [Terriglobales bacterium]
MPIQPLHSLPNGCSVFLDANVFVYGGDGRSRECAKLLQRCSRQEVLGVTLFQTVNEATHRFMLIEVEELGLLGHPSARAMRKRPRLVGSLKKYWQRTEHVLNLNLLFLSLDEALLRQAQVERSSFGLLTNDSMIAACMRQYGISFIASNDEDFGAISGLTLFRPGDLT